MRANRNDSVTLHASSLRMFLLKQRVNEGRRKHGFQRQEEGGAGEGAAHADSWVTNPRTSSLGQGVGRLGAPRKDDAAASYATNLKTESRFALLRENLGSN